MVYYSQPFAVSAISGLALPGSPGLALQSESFDASKTTVEPVVRKTFPESWIFDDFKEYVLCNIF